MALLPAIWLSGLRVRGTRCAVEWWWLAAAFGVSWLADTAAMWVDPWLVSLVYPVSQSAIVGAVLLDRREAIRFTLTLMAVGVVAVLWRGVGQPDVLLRTVAWLTVAGLAVERREPVRSVLLIAFGAGWLAWMGYATWPGWPSYLIYQAVRATGIAAFCWAAMRTTPQLSLARRARG